MLDNEKTFIVSISKGNINKKEYYVFTIITSLFKEASILGIFFK